MTPYGDIDLTRYLQTEGRRRAAALAQAARERNTSAGNTGAQQQSAGTAAANTQQQGEIPSQRCPAKPPGSLAEMLAQMGVAQRR